MTKTATKAPVAPQEYSLGLKLKIFTAREVNGNKRPKKGGRSESYMALTPDAAVEHLLYTRRLSDKKAEVVPSGRLKGSVKSQGVVWAFC